MIGPVPSPVRWIRAGSSLALPTWRTLSGSIITSSPMTRSIAVIPTKRYSAARTPTTRPRAKHDERGLGQFRRLQRNRTHVKPAVCAVGAIKKKNREEQKRSRTQKRENQRRMLQAFVIHLHGHDHHGKSRNRPYQ